MAEPEKPVLSIDKAAPETPQQRKLRTRSFKLDSKEKDDIARHILQMVDHDMAQRQSRMNKRMARRAKLMGWMGPKDWPWPDASQVYLPIMQIANLKTRGTLENAIKSMRPILEALARQSRNEGKQDSINEILDYQFFTENPGEDIIEGYCTNVVEDEAAYLFVQWVKETQSYHDVRLLPGLDPTTDPVMQILQLLPELFPTMLTQRSKDDDGYEWEVTYEDDEKQLKTASVCFYDTHDNPPQLECHIVVDMTTHNGPCISVEDFEDIVYPARAANLQPPSSSNPRGAAYVARLCTLQKDTIKRRMDDHTYDQLTDEEWDRITASAAPVASGEDNQQEKEQKDRIEGVETPFGRDSDELEQVVWFGRLDVNKDGLDEDVIAWVLRDSRVLCKLALLSEIYPGVPVRRPFAAKSFIPITNRVAGISQSELLESLQDSMQSLMDMHIDGGTLANTPMFFYRAASGLKSEPISIEPGIGYPLDNPQQDIAFPTWPTKDSTFAINSITLLEQFVERISMVSDVSLGRVPVGKSAALRNTGSMMALLGQGDLRSEQVLRRVFAAFAEIFSLMHRLNRRFLPDKKEIRVIGKQQQGQGGYTEINRENLDADVDFEFKATLLNTNKQVLSTNLQMVMGMAFTPMAFQAGFINQDQMYQLLRDFTKALDLDPDKYWTRPAGIASGPRIFAEEAISAVVANEMPVGQPAEVPPEMHLQKLQQFVASLELGFLTTSQSQMLSVWMQTVQMQIMQAQLMMQALGAGQTAPGSSADAQGGTQGSQVTGDPTGPGNNAPMNPGEKIDESIGAPDNGLQ